MAPYSLDITSSQVVNLVNNLSLQEAKAVALLLAKRIEVMEKTANQLPEETALHTLPFSVRVLRLLADNGLHQVKDLREMGLRKLLRRKGVGSKAIQEIRELTGVEA